MRTTRPATVCLLALLILLLAMGLRFPGLATQSLWSDEGNSVMLARAALADIAARTALDIHPPLYYWLLHAWVSVWGDSEFAVRMVSAFASLLLVAVTYRLGRQVLGDHGGLLAALAAAVSTFQIYYAQEARMYALLALLGGLTMRAAVGMARASTTDDARTRRPWLRWALLYVSSAALGLYTHYAFTVVLAATALSGLASVWLARRHGHARRRLAVWLLCQLVPLIVFLPWAPVALRQLTTWPAPAPAPLILALMTVWRTLTAGPTGTEQPLIWLVVPGVLGLAGLARLPWRRSPAASALVVLCLGMPMALTVALFKPAYLKFLLVATPAWCLLVAAALAVPPPGTSRRRVFGAVVALAGSLVLVLAARAPLAAYFTDPATARDDYRGVARYLEATGGPADAVLLNAPGQQEVFGYYYRGSAPVYPLPRSRPLDRAATVTELESIAARSRQIYAVYWATDESDPQGVVEGWLREHTFEATGWWAGNLRVVIYATPWPATEWTPDQAQFGDHFRLVAHRLAFPAGARSRPAVRPGDIIQVQLRWQADAALPDHYVVFLQALDTSQHVVGQRDASPLTPGTRWEAGQTVTDHHGLLILPGTPPGEYRLVAGLYDATSGTRLPLSPLRSAAADHLTLSTFAVERPAEPPAAAVLRIRHATDVVAGPFRLIGHDCFRLGHDSDPDTPLRPGEPLHVILYWRADTPPEHDWQINLRVASTADGAPAVETSQPLAGVDYAATRWLPDEVVRAQYDLVLPGGMTPGDYTLEARLTVPDAGDGADTPSIHVCQVRVAAN
jgi:mannosyltransferase